MCNPGVVGKLVVITVMRFQLSFMLEYLDNVRLWRTTRLRRNSAIPWASSVLEREVMEVMLSETEFQHSVQIIYFHSCFGRIARHQRATLPVNLVPGRSLRVCCVLGVGIGVRAVVILLRQPQCRFHFLCESLKIR